MGVGVGYHRPAICVPLAWWSKRRASQYSPSRPLQLPPGYPVATRRITGTPAERPEVLAGTFREVTLSATGTASSRRVAALAASTSGITKLVATVTSVVGGAAVGVATGTSCTTARTGSAVTTALDVSVGGTTGRETASADAVAVASGTATHACLVLRCEAVGPGPCAVRVSGGFQAMHVAPSGGGGGRGTDGGTSGGGDDSGGDADPGNATLVATVGGIVLVVIVLVVIFLAYRCARATCCKPTTVSAHEAGGFVQNPGGSGATAGATELSSAGAR